MIKYLNHIIDICYSIQISAFDIVLYSANLIKIQVNLVRIDN